MFNILWLKGLIIKRTARLIGMVCCIGLAVLLFSSLGLFFASSKAHMTQAAIAGVPVDWQIRLAPGTDVKQAEQMVRHMPEIATTRPVGYADVPYLQASTGETVQKTGQGKALGITSDYAGVFPGEMRFLVGSKNGVLLAQQTAANLQVGVGSMVTIGRPGASPVDLRVQGIVDLPAADSLFQVVGAPPGAGPNAPPDNVVLLPMATWHTLFDPVAKENPAAIHTQIHARLSHDLPRDPGLAFSQNVSWANNLEAKLAGGGLVGNNLGAQLDAGRTDALYAQFLFLFLGLPGIVLAVMLASVAGASGRDRRRKEQALLRVRGATPKKMVVLAVAEAGFVGVLGVILGLSSAVVTGNIAFGSSSFGETPAQAYGWISLAALLGLLLSVAIIVIPAWRDRALLTVRQAQATIVIKRRPLWSRVYLDIMLLAGSGAIFWQSMRDAYQVILVPEGIPTISINYLTLLAPLMFWLGSALLVWRLSNGLLVRAGSMLAFVIRPISRALTPIVAASMSRQTQLLARGLVIVALSMSFALSVAIFNTTYMNQARVDAELTNGADVTVTSAGTNGLPPSIVASAKALPGVAAAEPMQHRFAYVGNDLQDLYGINPSSIGNATPLSDAFFTGGSARQILGKLKTRPDAILVSDETVKDFQLQPGDMIRVRLLSQRDHAYHTVAFHYVGIAKEFPTAPRDSFLVANASYVARMTSSTAYETLLVRTAASPPSVANKLRSMLGPVSGATVHDIVTQLKITLSGLTAIDLSGLTKLELTFAIILILASSSLVLALGFIERRRSFAIISALGANARQLASFVWSEMFFVISGGLLSGIIGGWVLSLIIVKILTGVFDPPPEFLSVPWLYLAFVLASVIVSAMIVIMAVLKVVRKPSIKIIRDL